MERIAEHYLTHQAVLESAVENHQGAKEREALAFFSQFEQQLAGLDKCSFAALLNDLERRDHAHLEHGLFNLLFEYGHRCWFTENGALVLPILGRLDKSGYLKPYFQQVIRKQCGAPESLEAMETLLAGPYGQRESPFSVQYDMAYCGTDHPKQKLDIYRPRSIDPGFAPALLYFHGGAWAYGDRMASIKRFRHFADMGVVLVSVGYRLSGECSWPAPMDDAAAAFDFVYRNAEELEIDPNRIGVWGSSAGSHLAGLVAGGARGTYASRVRCYLNYCAPVRIDSHVAKLSGAAREVSPVMQLLGGDHEKLSEYAREATLSKHVTEGFPPTFIVHGSEDDTVPVEESEYLAKLISSLGSTCDLHLLQGSGHRIDDSLVAPHLRRFIQENL